VRAGFRRALAVSGGVAVLALGGTLARAEVVQQDGVRVAVAGNLSPERLPRAGSAPIAVTVDGGIASVDGSLPPTLRTLRIELNRHGRLETRGLPECRIGQIHPASTGRALAACRPALVGEGSFSVDVVLGSQEPYPTEGRLLVFNGTYKGRPALLGQIYAAHPFANSFVIPFQISRAKHGPFGILLTARLPHAFTSWGRVTGLRMRLSRRYSYRGSRHSFVNAGCPAPAGFSRASFQLARTTFAFSGGLTLRATVDENCRVK
jgi:hypothetical protein